MTCHGLSGVGFMSVPASFGGGTLEDRLLDVYIDHNRSINYVEWSNGILNRPRGKFKSYDFINRIFFHNLRQYVC